MFVGLLAAGSFATPAVAADRGGLIKVIVNFKGQRLEAGEARRTIRQAGGTLERRFRLINSASVAIPAGLLNALQKLPNVQSVEIDAKITAFEQPNNIADHTPDTGNDELEAAWGVEHIGAGDVHGAGNTGQGVKVGIIDTGIDYNHVDLDGVYGGGWDFINDDADPFDDHGHGTHVAGILAGELNDPASGVVGVAPGASIYAYKVLNASGQGDYSDLIAALEQADLVDHVDVVNMSLGGSVGSDALAAAVAAAYSHGITLVAASGNVNPNDLWQLLFGCPVAYPAAYPQVFATTFTAPNDGLTGFSCTGTQVDFAAPGDLIYSTVPTGSCPLCAPSGYRGDLSGTSMASPHLAGTVALVLAHGIANSGDPTTVADDVKAHLCATADVGFGVLTSPIPTTDPRYPQYFGCGVVDANNALITNPPPLPPPPATNQPPAAADDSAVTVQDTPITVDVLANDADPDGDGIAIVDVSGPAHGTAVDGPGGVTYTPAAGFVGSDSFQYTIEDDFGASATATVAVTVNVPAGPTMHVGDLDAVPTRQSTRWTARVTIRVHNGAEGNVANVVVTGLFGNGAVRSCTTGTKGKCTVSVAKLLFSLPSITFDVTNLTKSGRIYVPSANHDVDGSSNGTSIVVRQP